MNIQLFNYIFDIREIGLKISNYLSFNDCVKNLNFVTKSTNEIIKYKIKHMYFLIYECNKSKIIYGLNIHLNNYLSIPACKHNKLCGKIYIINQNKKIDLSCNIIKKNNRYNSSNNRYNYSNNRYNSSNNINIDDFSYKNDSNEIKLTKIYKKIMKERIKYKKLFYIGEYQLSNIINIKSLNKLKIFFSITKYYKNIKYLDTDYYKKYINNIYNYKINTLCMNCKKYKYTYVNNYYTKKIICKECYNGYIYQINLCNNY